MKLTTITFVLFITMVLLTSTLTIIYLLRAYKHSQEKLNMLFVILVYIITIVFEIIYLIKVLFVI